MRKALMEYLPQVLRDTAEFQQIMSVEQESADRFFEALDSVFSNQFIDTADETGIRRYEKILNLTPKDTDRLDDRRFRIKAKINEQLPFTIRVLQRQLTAGKKAFPYS